MESVIVWSQPISTVWQAIRFDSRSSSYTHTHTHTRTQSAVPLIMIFKPSLGSRRQTTNQGQLFNDCVSHLIAANGTVPDLNWLQHIYIYGGIKSISPARGHVAASPNVLKVTTTTRLMISSQRTHQTENALEREMRCAIGSTTDSNQEESTWGSRSGKEPWGLREEET